MLAEAIRFSVVAGGKRLRPILCLAAADAVGGDPGRAMPAACAIEFIHTYSLIHDDLPAMDNDTMRRGKPTLHVVAGEALAILAGDGLLTEAFALMAREPGGRDAETSARKLRVIRLVSDAAGPAGMVGGQALDLHGSTALSSSEPDDLRAMHARKTGALIRASAVAGAVMGEGHETVIAAIDEAATEFGLAFQIIDDVLDVEGAPATLGKNIGKDAAAGKHTYAGRYGPVEARRLALECLDRAERTLRSAGLHDSRLMEIGHWLVNRSH